MKISDLIAEGANVYVTVSVADLRGFFEEVVKDTAAKERAAEAERNADGVMSQTDVCKFLGVSKSTLWRWDKYGYLSPSGRMGRTPQYLKSDVERIKKGS